MEYMKARDEEAEDVNWEELLDSGCFGSRSRCRLGAGMDRSTANSSEFWTEPIWICKLGIFFFLFCLSFGLWILVKNKQLLNFIWLLCFLLFHLHLFPFFLFSRWRCQIKSLLKKQPQNFVLWICVLWFSYNLQLQFLFLFSFISMIIRSRKKQSNEIIFFFPFTFSIHIP